MKRNKWLINEIKNQRKTQISTKSLPLLINILTIRPDSRVPKNTEEGLFLKPKTEFQILNILPNSVANPLRSWFNSVPFTSMLKLRNLSGSSISEIIENF